MHYSFLRILLALSIALCSGAALTTDASAQGSIIRFETLTVEDGLSQSSVWGITQDKFGYIWFGTDDGLNLYDGYAFTYFTHDPGNANSLSSNIITALHSDQRGDLWIGTQSGLDRYDVQSRTFSHYPFVEEGEYGLWGSLVVAIDEDSRGNIWIGTRDGGINLLIPSSGSILHYFSVSQEAWNNQIADIAVDGRGWVWAATNTGLYSLDPLNVKITQYTYKSNNPNSLSDNNCLSVFASTQGDVWIGTAMGGLNRFNPQTGRFTRFKNDPDNSYTLISNQVTQLLEDDQGSLWIGTPEGLDRFDPGTSFFNHFSKDVNNPYSLSDDTITSLFEDRTGVIWVGTQNGGVNYYSRTANKFQRYIQKSGGASKLSDANVYGIAETPDGTLWAGTKNGGLNRINRRTGAVRYYYHLGSEMASLKSNQLRTLLVDSRGVLWIGTENAGLDRYNPSTDSFVHYTIDPIHPEIVEQYSITALFDDSQGRLWVGTRGYGLHRLNPRTNTFQHVQLPEQNRQNGYIRTIFEDPEGRLWLGTDAGLYVYDPEERDFSRYINLPGDSASLPSNRVTGIAPAGDETYWLTSLGGGLSRFHPVDGVLETFSEANGLANDQVYGLLREKQGQLWLSTNAGLSRFDPLEQTFKNYDVSDGLPGNEFNPGAFFQSPRGEFFFGAVNGLVSFFPAAIRDNPIPPGVVIRSFKRFNQTERQDLLGGEQIELSYQDNFISFEFAALDFTAPAQNQFAYQLIGFDQDWVNAGTRNYVSYTNLRGGDYTFKVKAANSDGVWNETGIAIQIHVEPPFWTRWWFITLAVLATVSGIFAAYRLRIRAVESQRRELEIQISERTKEIERRRQVAESLREIIAILNRDRSLTHSLEHIIQEASQLVQADGVLIFHSLDENSARVLAANMPGSPQVTPWLCETILQGEPLVIPDLTAYDFGHSPLEGSPFPAQGSLLGLPLAVSDQVDGGLILYFRKTGPVTDEDLKICQTLAEHTALAIANARLRSQAEDYAKTSERNRLARELHDAVTQNLFASTLIADVLPRIFQRNPQAGQRQLDELRLLTRGALAEMRALLVELRPGALSEAPLAELLQQLCDAFSGRMRVPIQCTLNLPAHLPAEVQIGFYRIAQEALNNIAKHSRATLVSVSISQPDGSLVMSIRDNGRGFEPGAVNPAHFGLDIMGERAQSIGAEFHLESTPGAGTLIEVCWRNPNCSDLDPKPASDPLE